MEGAVAAVRSRGDTATADLWQETLDNLTMGAPGCFCLPGPLLSPFAAAVPCIIYADSAAVQRPPRFPHPLCLHWYAWVRMACNRSTVHFSLNTSPIIGLDVCLNRDWSVPQSRTQYHNTHCDLRHSTHHTDKLCINQVH